MGLFFDMRVSTFPIPLFQCTNMPYNLHDIYIFSSSLVAPPYRGEKV
jgi:hypothetical protein